MSELIASSFGVDIAKFGMRQWILGGMTDVRKPRIPPAGGQPPECRQDSLANE